LFAGRTTVYMIGSSKTGAQIILQKILHDWGVRKIWRNYFDVVHYGPNRRFKKTPPKPESVLNIVTSPTGKELSGRLRSMCLYSGRLKTCNLFILDEPDGVEDEPKESQIIKCIGFSGIHTKMYKVFQKILLAPDNF
jgi:hypothetical protein